MRGKIACLLLLSLTFKCPCIFFFSETGSVIYRNINGHKFGQSSHTGTKHKLQSKLYK